MTKLSVQIGTALALCAVSSLAFATQVIAERIARVESGLRGPNAIKGQLSGARIADRMAALNVPGVSVAVINKGVIEWARGYGVAEASGTRQITPETLFQAASISKPVAAFAALALVEKGTLALDGDVNTQLTTWKVPAGAQSPAAPVTLRRLLNNSAGTTVSGFRGYARGEPLPTLPQLLDGVKPANSDPVRVQTTPGVEWKYSGGGFSIAQHLMTDASGKPFATLMHDTVLAPLGMTNSTFEQPLPPALHAVSASGHTDKGQPVQGQWHTYPEQAAAGLWTTPSDLARFAIALQDAIAGRSNKIVSKAMTAQMLTRLKGNYGLGLFVGEIEGQQVFQHGGHNEGFRTMMVAFTRSGQGAVVMTNGERGDALAAQIIRGIAAVYGWNDWQATEKVLAKSALKNYGSYEGNYQLNGKPISVTRERERLFISAANFGLDRVELFPTSSTRFFNLNDEVEFFFEKKDNGKFDMVIQLDRPLRATRVM
jgi:CubicO group peptidase (beta-lactamase class C family)